MDYSCKSVKKGPKSPSMENVSMDRVACCVLVASRTSPVLQVTTSHPVLNSHFSQNTQEICMSLEHTAELASTALFRGLHNEGFKKTKNGYKCTPNSLCCMSQLCYSKTIVQEVQSTTLTPLSPRLSPLTNVTSHKSVQGKEFVSATTFSGIMTN